jgi:alkylation response protein AidB-like acyl-CoA dehydrogenase
LLGEEGKGFFVVLSNFNHERWSMLTGATMNARMVVEECFKWATQRKVFGKRLIDQPVIRNKLAKMVSVGCMLMVLFLLNSTCIIDCCC